MQSTDKASLYEGRKKDFSEELKKVTESISRISTTRLVIAAGFFVVIYFSVNMAPLAILLLPMAIYFAVLVTSHGREFKRKIRFQNLTKINDQEIKALNGNLDSLAPGTEFINLHHPYAHDLDLFGEGSIFQYSNRGNSFDGKRKFAESLTTHLPDRATILLRQEAIKEISSKLDFRQNIQAGGMEMPELATDREQLRQWLKHPSFVFGKPIVKYILIVIPALTLISIAGAFFLPFFKGAAILLVLFQWAYLGFYSKRINAFHDYISRKKNILEKYAAMLHILAKEPATSSELRHLAAQAQEAGKEVEKLAKLVSALDARANFLTSMFTNSVLLYDLQCVYRLEKWKGDHASRLNAWLDAIAEAEVLCSWGNFSFNNPEFSYATIHDALTLEAKSLGHPLIGRHERISNDVFIGNDQRIQLVTGANMAGKSTFLRSIGVNVILALAGAPVCAEEFRCPIIHLRTGMRAADSLKDHQSYFYAELNRLKSIMDELQQEKPLLVLLDEILKGTNSTDKLTGSMAMVKQLLPHPCLALIATHDLALGELEITHADAIKNFCFEANIENDQLFFDYKLKRGLATKMNATFLMKKMGIIPS